MRLYFLLLVIWSTSLCAQDTNLLPFGSNWSYLADGSNQGIAWRAFEFDESTWLSGPAPLGYGEGNEGTIVSFGPDPNDKFITTYFRHHFTITDVSLFHNFLLKLKKDDAAVVFVNGLEVMRSNFDAGNVNYKDLAYSTISSEEEDIIWEDLIHPDFFQTGENVIAVEVHQRDEDSTDKLFDLELIGLDQTPSLYRSPYLQQATPDGITVRWKTDVPTDTKLWYGAQVSDLSIIIENPDLTVEHEVTISGLTSNTDYFYKIGNSENEFAGGTADFFFTTLPEFGTAEPTRIWVTGDAGTGKDEQYNTRNAYLNYIGAEGKADLWLMLGDNAYEHGRQSDYHMGLFTPYPDILQNTVSFPAAGNHDLLGNSSAISETGTYYDIFTLPKNGECGGIPSNKESYYAVDYGNIHIICLESYDLDRKPTGAMATWLKEDLENTTADWLIAYWHFPPYSKVSHDTDDPDDFSGRSTDMRKNFNPILEQYGIDLVLSGHSHGYERSYLIDGHYGTSTTLTSDMILDDSSGDINGTGAYRKPRNLPAHKGTVYAVCGSSGKLSSPLDDGPHPVMHLTNTDFAGSMIIDIVGDTLEAKFLNEQGIIQDYFHIVKENPSATQSIELNSIFKIYPNPSKDSFYLQLRNETELSKARLEIYATDGRLVKKIDLGILAAGGNTKPIDVSGFASGSYTVKLLNADKHLNSQLLIVQD